MGCFDMRNVRCAQSGSGLFFEGIIDAEEMSDIAIKNAYQFGYGLDSQTVEWSKRELILRS